MMMRMMAIIYEAFTRCSPSILLTNSVDFLLCARHQSGYWEEKLTSKADSISTFLNLHCNAGREAIHKNKHNEINNSTKINILIPILYFRKQMQSSEVICPPCYSQQMAEWGRVGFQSVSIRFFLLHYAVSQKRPTTGEVRVKRRLYVGICPSILK